MIAKGYSSEEKFEFLILNLQDGVYAKEFHWKLK